MNGHLLHKKNTYVRQGWYGNIACLVCKAESQRRAYWRNPEAERERNRRNRQAG